MVLETIMPRSCERPGAAMLGEIFDQIRLAAACVAARRLEECPADPKARGWYAEKVVARRLGAGLWADLEKALQRVIHNDAGLKDQGVDLVAIREDQIELIQVKWYEQRQTIGVDVVAKLVNIAVACQERLGLATRPRMRCIYRDGCRIARSAVNFDLIEWDPWPPEIIEGVRPCPPTPPPPADDHGIYGTELAARLEGPQKAAFEAVLGAMAGDRRHLRVQMPVGSGKSHVAFALARHILRRSAQPALIVAPRGEIVSQLDRLGGLPENSGLRVLRAGQADREWPQAGHGDLVVSTGQMLNARLKNREGAFRVSLLVVDEAHNATGQNAIEAGAVEWGLRVDLSACPFAGDGPPVVHTLGWGDAVRAKAVCDVLFHFVHFALVPGRARPEPWYEEMAAHLDAHPDRYRSVLACFRTIADARGFVGHYQARRPGENVAGSFVGDDPQGCLEAFRAGRLRVLCVVGRVEMGVNIHRCDTVLFMDPWDSLDRTLQLMGRACRLHPEKPGFFRVVVGFSADDPDTQDRLRKFQGALGGVYPDLAGDPQEFLGRVRHLAGGGDGKVPADLERHVVDVREAHARQVSENVYSRNGLVDHAAYLAAREKVRSLRLSSSANYQEFLRQRSSEPEPDPPPYLPDDPAAWFGHLFEGEGAGFPWSEFLGSDGEEAAGVGEKLRAAYAEALNKGDLDSSSIGAWAGDLVYLVLRQTSAGASLPECPPLEEKGWPSFYNRHLVAQCPEAAALPE